MIADLYGNPAELIADTDSVSSDARRLLAYWLAGLKPDWHDDAACRGTPAEVFFPEGRTNLAEARALCASCPVRAECLDEALDDPTLDHGFRGGYTAKQRRELRQEAA